MGTQRGKILLEGKKIQALMIRMKSLRKQKKISYHDIIKLEKVVTMASWYIRGIEEFARTRGQYQECFPALAKGISRIFYATDEEMAICFGVSHKIFCEWINTYPKLKAAIRVGKGILTRAGGPYACYRRLLYPDLAKQICAEFNADDEQLARCFGVDLETLKEWLHYEPTFLNGVINGRHVSPGVERKRIANEIWGSLQDPKDDGRVRLRHLDLLQDMIGPEKKTLSDETICDFTRRVSRLVDLLHSKEDISILSWLNQNIEKEDRADFLRSVEIDYQEAVTRYEASDYLPDAAQGRFFDGLQYVYCEVMRLPANENTRVDSFRWLKRKKSGLSYLIVAGAVGLLIERMREYEQEESKTDAE